MEDVQEGKDYHFPREEEVLLEHWAKTDAFKEQLRRSEDKPEFIFYDGPPFATGLPHYGHLLAGSLKVRTDPAAYVGVLRYPAAGTECGGAFAGYCHAICEPNRAPCPAALRLGLPRSASRVRDRQEARCVFIGSHSRKDSHPRRCDLLRLQRNEAWHGNGLAGINSREDVLKMGIGNYNEECRSIVMKCELTPLLHPVFAVVLATNQNVALV